MYCRVYLINVWFDFPLGSFCKACHDAHIALSEVKGLDSSETYEIVIGGWSDSQSVIRDCKQCLHKDEIKHRLVGT